jgi:dihydrofolate reductase
MGKVIISIAMSLDGFIAGPDDRPGQGLGKGGEVLHEWMQDADLEEMFGQTGALVVGRRMFDVSGWGPTPPGGLPCFVLTHKIPDEWSAPGSSYTFVTSGIMEATALARMAAGDKNVGIGGGADICRQALEAGLVDEMDLKLVPVLLGGGISLFDHIKSTPISLRADHVTESPHATHLRYTVLNNR